MKLRQRILLASGLLIIAPLLLLALGIRAETERRLTAQYTRRISTLMGIIEEDLARLNHDLAIRMSALKGQIADDNLFRRAVADSQSELRPYLLGYAGRAMTLMGLDMLQLQDPTGRIVSSGHFRNEYDRQEASLPRLLSRAAGGMALVSARRPGGSFLALARVDSVRLAGRSYSLIGGVAVDSDFLAGLTRDPEMDVSVVTSNGAASTDPQLQVDLARVGQARLDQPELSLGKRNYFMLARDIPLVPPAPGRGRGLEAARLIVTHPMASLQDVLHSLHLWLLVVLLATLAGSLLLAIWLSQRISRPLASLARQTAQVDLDRLDTTFPTDRQDEVGVLSRFLAAMTERLRLSVARMREAERRATLGELARQVNHDIRNGLTPIRNVVRHLAEVAGRTPEQLVQVFQERKGTLDSGLAYLEDLAANYARLSPQRQRRSCSLNDIVRQAIADQPASDRIRISVQLEKSLPDAFADPVGMRRIIENLLRNARESLAGGEGAISVTTGSRRQDDPEPETVSNGDQRQLVLTIADSGCGIAAEDRDKIFTDFYTTKDHGTGLGLSIIRRLVADFDGSIRLESRQGHGTTVFITLPAAPPKVARAAGVDGATAASERKGAN